MLYQLAFLIVLPLLNLVVANTRCSTTGSDVVICRTCPSQSCGEVRRIHPRHKDNYNCMFLDGEMVGGKRHVLTPDLPDLAECLGT